MTLLGGVPPIFRFWVLKKAGRSKMLGEGGVVGRPLKRFFPLHLTDIAILTSYLPRNPIRLFHTYCLIFIKCEVARRPSWNILEEKYFKSALVFNESVVMNHHSKGLGLDYLFPRIG